MLECIYGVSVHFEHRTSCNRIPPAASFRPIVKHLFSFWNYEHIKQQHESSWLPAWKSHVLVSQQKEFMLNSNQRPALRSFVVCRSLHSGAALRARVCQRPRHSTRPPLTYGELPASALRLPSVCLLQR